MPKEISQEITIGAVETKHPDYEKIRKSWIKVRDCMEGEDTIKAARTTYLPQPAGMKGEFESAYDGYVERAHFPLITSYALSGTLGIVVNKLPEFNVPKQLEYIIDNSTKDGRSLQQLFLDIVIEVFQTGRVPLLVDIVPGKDQFRFVPYKAESFINWKTALVESEKNLTLGVFTETRPSGTDAFSHEVDEVYRVVSLNNGVYQTNLFDTDGRNELIGKKVNPSFMGKTIDEIPLFLAGSINNSFEIQPIPLIPVANCSIQIYRKEADLANSEYLSCNPTLCVTGATNDDDLPNVVGSSVMIVLPNDQARIFYTQTDTDALSHVKEHITDLYDEAIRHGVAILDARKGVEAAESLRIRQSTQSASIYSTYLAAINAINQGLKLMCRWAGYNEDEVITDAPSSLTSGIPDSAVLKETIEGYANGVIPLPVIHRYLVYSGLLDQKVGLEDYKILLDEGVERRKKEKESGLGPDSIIPEEDKQAGDNKQVKDKDDE